ncbi:MAG: DUF4317 domain-containing protein [Faecalimonas sp.]|nr:DUF4317 domain-containing protein [Faecalimonas sp.]
MNKKEVLEIRKQYVPEHCTITRICGCYVDGNKEIVAKSKDAFLSLPEEEIFKYLTLFKQTLSGTIGKNLINLTFPLAQEMPGGTQSSLLHLRNSKLQDDKLLDEFYREIIENYNYGENYYIILIHVAYDVPGKANDGSEMFDASEEVFDYILCSICPVHLSKEGLCYNPETNHMENRIRDWIVEAPEKGFLFPAFNDRTTDIHSLLYFSKQAEDLQPDFVENALGCIFPMSAGSQKNAFQSVVLNTLGDECEYEVLRNIHDNLNEIIEDAKKSPEPPVLTKPDVKRLLENSGVTEERMEVFEDTYDHIAGSKTEFLVPNIAETRKFSIETPDIVIKVNPERADLVETRLIDGRQCLVIEMNDHVEVNGVSIRTNATN